MQSSQLAKQKSETNYEKEERKGRKKKMTQVFREITLPQQKIFDGVPLPLVLSPNSDDDSVSKSHCMSLTEAITTHKTWLASRLHESGAILFRGFPVPTASDFKDVVEAFGYDEFVTVGSAAPRIKVTDRVYTANEAPPNRKIPFHHEMAQLADFPTKLLFFCEVEPKSGGETPIVLSHIIYNRMKEAYPDFVQQIEQHGLIYSRVVGGDDDPLSYVGRGWKSTYMTQDKSVAEERAARLGTKLEWLEDGGVKTMIGPVSGVKFDKSRKRNVWFSIFGVYTTWEGENDPKAVTFGDGSPLPTQAVHDCLQMHEEECVAIPWQKGDVLLLDNWAIVHSRRSFEPPRRILASICK